MSDNKDWNKHLRTNFVIDNTIFIHGVFDKDISIDILPKFDKLIKEGKEKKEGKIIIDIASNGGITYYLKCLLIRVEKAKKEGIIIETRAFAHTYSCGSLLACSGTKKHRFISEFTEHCCHLGSGGFFAENDIELIRQSERLKAHFDMVRNIYKKYAKIPNLEEVIKDDCLFIRGEQIIEWGLADKFY